MGGTAISALTTVKLTGHLGAKSPFLITAGGPEQRSEILPVYVYKVALSGGELGFGAAISFVMLLINLVIALVYLRMLGRRKEKV